MKPSWQDQPLSAGSERIPVAGPSVTEREAELAAEAARTAWYGDHYAFNARFEEMFAEYVGVAHAMRAVGKPLLSKHERKSLVRAILARPSTI